MNRFHDSRFAGIRLVCRLRRGSNANVSPAKVSPAMGPSMSAGNLSQAISDDPEDDTHAGAIVASGSPKQRVKEKYYIIKSLTVDDLERSVTTGIWATQSHNETVLNLAFEVCEIYV